MDDALDSKSRRMFNEYQQNLLPIIQAIGNSHRYKILMTLIDHNSEFQELLSLINLGKTALAHHLRTLIDLDLIVKSKRGKYGISQDGKIILHGIMKGYLDTQLKFRFDQRLQALYYQIKHQNNEEKKMNSLPVKIISLPPMKVASVRVISQSPENDAWEKMKSYADKNHLLDDLDKHPVYGFNNPDPTPDKKEYGYEFWIKIDSSVKTDDEVIIKEIPSALYAVTLCYFFEDIQSDFMKTHGILETWHKLFVWVQESKFEKGTHQWLEKALNPGVSPEEMKLDLYMPIVNLSDD